MAGEYDNRDLFDDEHPGRQVSSPHSPTLRSARSSQQALIVTPSTTLTNTIHLMQRERRA